MTDSTAAETGATEQKKPRRLRLLYGIAGVLGALFVLALIGLRLYFSDAYFKDVLETELTAALNDRPTHIDKLEISLLAGRVEIEGIRVEQTDKTLADKDLFRLERAEIEVALWPLLAGSGKRIASRTTGWLRSQSVSPV